VAAVRRHYLKFFWLLALASVACYMYSVILDYVVLCVSRWPRGNIGSQMHIPTASILLFVQLRRRSGDHRTHYYRPEVSRKGIRAKKLGDLIF